MLPPGYWESSLASNACRVATWNAIREPRYKHTPCHCAPHSSWLVNITCINLLLKLAGFKKQDSSYLSWHNMLGQPPKKRTLEINSSVMCISGKLVFIYTMLTESEVCLNFPSWSSFNKKIIPSHRLTSSWVGFTVSSPTSCHLRRQRTCILWWTSKICMEPCMFQKMAPWTQQAPAPPWPELPLPGEPR